MSLFKVCSWWSAQCPDYESNYDSQLLHCCRFGIDDTEKDYIVVGSHSGYLSVFKPNATYDEDEQNASFKPTDQLLEIKLPCPIIQITSGKFLFGSDVEGQQQLVVLHPMKLSVYSLQSTEGLAEHGNQFKLNLCFEHKFNKLAYSLCHGNFGGYKAREFFCMTHMDSTISFFEQDGIAYEIVLCGERHIPSKIVYNQRTDSFFMVSSYCELESYRYQDLGQVSDTKKKNIFPAWTVCIGEYPLDMQIQQISASECVILVLCENFLYGITDLSFVKFMKRLDYSPICFSAFVAGWYYEPDARLVITVISDSGTMLIYYMANLIWAAQLSDVPVAICRSNLDCLAGAIVALNANGKIDIAYLGSEPQLFQVPPLNLQKMNFEKTQMELIELEKEIKSGIDFTDVSMINATAERDLHVDVSISNTLETSKYPMKQANPSISTDEMKMILISVMLKANANLEQIQIQCNVQPPLKCSKEINSFQNLAVNKIEHFDTWIYVENNVDIPSTAANIIISFINKQSIPRIIEKKVFMPLKMFYRLHPPQKEATIKLTLSANKNDSPSIEQLFSKDFSVDTNSHGAIGFKSIYSGKIVTIVTGKHSNRYRIQSDHLPATAAIIEFLMNRFKSVEQETVGQTKIKITATPQLPIENIMNLVDSHHSANKELQSVRTRMQQMTTRMRLLERRFFTKLDDKTIDSIDSISTFLKSTHQEIMSEIQLLVKAKAELARAQINLSCALIVTTRLIKLFNLPSKISDSLCSALMPSVIDYKQQSWQEMTAPALDMINLIGPLRKNKNSAIDEDPTYDVNPFEYDRFKRHLLGLLERVCRLCVQSSSEQKASDPTDDSLENMISVAETLGEEEDGEATAANNQLEEESDWVCDVKQTMDILPQI